MITIKTTYELKEPEKNYDWVFLSGCYQNKSIEPQVPETIPMRCIDEFLKHRIYDTRPHRYLQRKANRHAKKSKPNKPSRNNNHTMQPTHGQGKHNIHHGIGKYIDQYLDRYHGNALGKAHSKYHGTVYSKAHLTVYSKAHGSKHSYVTRRQTKN